MSDVDLQVLVAQLQSEVTGLVARVTQLEAQKAAAAAAAAQAKAEAAADAKESE